MTDPLFNDPSLRAATSALDGLSMRQQVISRNLANVDTPGYHAQSVDFESTLKQAIDGGNAIRLAATHPGHLASKSERPSFTITPRLGGSERADQNNVDVDTELTQMVETGIQYQAVSQVVSKKLALLKAIANDR